jgi:putative ABC transport system permease protein
MFMSSIILGITALVAINSFNYNLVRDIDEQSKTLLGADLVVSGNKALPDSLISKLDSLPGLKASEKELFSMAFIPKNEETQFVRIKAIEGDFPFYGKIITEPVDANTRYQANNAALVDDALMFEHQLEPGDSIKLGERTFKIEGRLKSAFGSVAIGSSFAPGIYINQEALSETELIQPGSMVDYSYYFKLPPELDTEKWRKDNRESFRNESFNIQTIEEQKENLSEAFGRLNSFLNIVALVSLLLGCIGVASSVLIYIKTKIPSIAVFRCLGLTGSQAFLIFFIQIFILGFLGVVVGCFLGSAIQIVLPAILKDFLPYEIDLNISWKAIWQGIWIGTLITSLFALVPLLSVRLISPLRTLRASFEEDTKPKDWLKTLIYLAIVLVIIAFLWSLTGDILVALKFTLGLLISFLLLYGIATLIMWFVKRSFPRHWNFVFRQGISNLFRPNNQTRTLIVSIGLGTSILTMLFIIQGLLLNNVDSMDAGDQPNMILYGIENSQKDKLAEMTKSFDLPLIQQVPIVTMRLAGWKGKSKSEWMADSSRSANRWAINREARVTYRDSLESDEDLLEGTYTGSINPGDSIFISLDQRYASSMDVDIGDEMQWNVQGTLLTTFVGSIRDIQFRSMRTRFFILFPTGVLENAPQFQVLVTKSPSPEVMGQYRREVVKAFPNVSVVDLGSILSTLNDILNKISYIIKFLAAFSILTGLIVLLSSLLLSKFQRIKESVILRTLGASKAQILKINATEYSILGSLSAATGIILALGTSFLLAKYELEMDFDIQWWPLILVFILILSLTVLIGLLNSREVIQKSPLEVLRKEIE